MTILLTVNSVIEWVHAESKNNILERVLWINQDKNQIVVFNLNDDNAFPEVKEMEIYSEAITNGSAIKRPVDPFVIAIPPNSDYYQKHFNEVESAWEIIKDIVVDEPDIYDEKLRGKMVTEVTEKYNKHKMTVYKYLKRYWRCGKSKQALFPRFFKSGGSGKDRGVKEGSKRGRPSRFAINDPEKTGVNIDDDIKRIFRVGVQLYYNKQNKYPLSRCFQLIKENHFNVGYKYDGDAKIPILPPAEELPTFGQFKYWYSKELDLKKTLIAREGSRGFHLRHRGVLGSSTQMAFGPGSIYQIDATIADVYLVNSYDRTKIIGKPVIYVVIDVFSRYIVGIYIGLEGPSWVGAKMALSNTFTDKVAFCKEYGIEIEEEDWYCPFLPESILADRGEIIGFNSDNVVEFLNVKISNTPPYRADWKGIVEQNFRKANLKTIHWLPGAVKKRYRERGEKDHRLDATLDLHQFTQIMIHTILNHNKYHRMHWYSRDEFMIQDHVEPIPSELWKWGIENRMGHLREKPVDLIMLSLMPHKEATVTPFGIRFEGMHYSCERAVHEGWFERARAYGTWKVPIAYDIRSKADTINLILNNGSSYEVCTLLDKDARYRGRRFEEVIDLLEYEKLNTAKYETTKNQGDAELNAYVQAITAEADEQTKQALGSMKKSDTKRTKEVRANRKEAREQVREEQKWDFRETESPIVSEDDIEEQIRPKLTKNQSFLKILKGQKGQGA